MKSWMLQAAALLMMGCVWTSGAWAEKLVFETYYPSASSTSGRFRDLAVGDQDFRDEVDTPLTSANGEGVALIQTSLGIGITALPAAALQVEGNAIFGSGEDTDAAGSAVIRGANGKGTDVSGGSLIFKGGRGTGTGAGGDLIFETASASKTSGTASNSFTEKMRVDSTGNVGIGTANPTERLHVVDETSGAVMAFDKYFTSEGEDAAAPRLMLRRARGSVETPGDVKNADNLGVVSFHGYGPKGESRSFQRAARIRVVAGGDWTKSSTPTIMQFFTTAVESNDDTTERMRITADGKVGIGTSSPAATLDVKGTVNVSSDVGIGITNPGSRLVVQGDGTTKDTSALNVTDSQKRSLLFAQNDGAIGIGTTNPTNSLAFGGNASRAIQMERNTTGDSAGSSLTIQAGGATSGATDKVGGDLLLSSGISTGTGSSGISFKTATGGTRGKDDRAPTTKVTILGSGNVGIGTASPTATLDVNGTARVATNLQVIGLTGLGVTNPTFRLELPNAADKNGRARANKWTTYSSVRWKENITPIEDALSKVMQLRGIYFDPKGGGPHDIGMVAEEVGKVVPELVDYEENGGYAQSMSYDRLVALLVEAIKEQQKQIEELKARLNAVE